MRLYTSFIGIRALILRCIEFYAFKCRFLSFLSFKMFLLLLGLLSGVELHNVNFMRIMFRVLLFIGILLDVIPISALLYLS